MKKKTKTHVIGTMLSYLECLPPVVKQAWEAKVEAQGARFDAMVSAWTELGFATIPDYSDGKSIVMATVRLDYDDDQPRGEGGRWSATGGGAGGVERAERAITGAGRTQGKSAAKEPTPGLKNIASKMKEQYKAIGGGKLPEGHENYFKSRPDSKVVPVNKLKFTADRTGAKGRAEEHMTRALLGGKKREPLLVTENPNGTYQVLNGNHTAQVAKEQGWKDVPVRVVDAPKIPPNFYSPEQTETMKASGKDRLHKLNDDGHLDTTASEQFKIAQDTMDKHQKSLPQALNRFTETVGGKGVEIEGRTKDIGSALEKVAKKAEDAIAPKWGKKSENDLIKEHGEEKAAEIMKGKTDPPKAIRYKSVADLQDGTGLRAILPTVPGDNIAIQKERAAEIEKRYQVVAKDNYVDSPQSGYRALHYIVKDKDGLEKEVQLQTRRQQNFQHWSHDVYKPVNDQQREALKKHSETIKAYADKVSDYLYEKDRGLAPTAHPGDLPAEALEAFGAARLDRVLTIENQ